MASGSRKRTKSVRTVISLPPELLKHARRRVREGVAPSLSGYFAALTRRDRDRRDFAVFVAEFEDSIGLTDADQARIDRELGLRGCARKAS